jgi:enterochelin esterase-like enzyme
MSMAAVLLDAQYRGVKWASLGSVPFRGETEDVKTRRIGRSCRRFLYNHGVSGYHYWTLAKFKSKFGARWESRMIAVGGGFSGVPLALAAIWQAHRRPAQANSFESLAAAKPEQQAPARINRLAAIHTRFGQLWHKDPKGGSTKGERRRRWVLSAVFAGFVTAAVLGEFGIPAEQWLFSEGAGEEVGMLLATLIVVTPSAVLCTLVGIGGWAAFTGTMSLFVAAYLIPFVVRAIGATVAPEITVRPIAIGWVDVIVSTTVLSAVASCIGVLLGSSLRRGLQPLVRRARDSRRVAVALAAAVLMAGLGMSQVPNLLSAGPVAMVYSYQPNQSVAQGDVVTLTVDGRQALMYKPAILRTHPSLSLPVVYFLHGQPGSQDDWLRGGAALPNILDQLIANKTIPPMVAVMPDGSADHFAVGVWSNTAQGQTSETWIVDSLMPMVARQVHTLGAECTGIAGYSEGGFAAVNIAMHRPDKFGIVASYSGYFDADPAAFGPAVAANSPSITARQLNSADRMPIFLGAGSTDVLRGTTEAFAKELSGLNWKLTTLVISPGSHSMGTWRTLIAESLTWMGKTWKTSTTQNGARSVCSPQF